MRKTCSLILLIALLFGVFLSVSIQNVFSQTPELLNPLEIPQWTNQIEEPPSVYVPKNVTDNSGKLIRQEYEVNITEFRQQLLPKVDSNGNPTGFGLTKVWGFEGEAKDAVAGNSIGSVRGTPGSTFEAIRGVPIQVKWANNLVDASGNPLTHMFAVDPTVHWANPNNMEMPNPATAPTFPPGYVQAQNPVPTVIHLHGGEVSAESDGHPEAWWTANGLHGPAYSTRSPTDANSAVFLYPNEQQPTTLWYHDHSLGITRLNVMSGLAGFYILRSNNDQIADLLPKGEYEMPLVIQDRNFLTDGSLYFPSRGISPSIHPYWNPDFVGNTIMVNGKVWPNMNVKQGQYRFRILDGSNSRSYTLHFSNNMPFIQIGSDGGYLKTSASVSSLTISPGERVDLLVDFSNLPAGEKVVLQNLDPALLSNDEKRTAGQIVQFTVSGERGEEPKSLPPNLNPTLNGDFPSLPSPTKKRTLTLIEASKTPNDVAMLLDGQPWDAPISEQPELGTTEEWVILNPTMNPHPIHLHLVQFQLVQRQTLASTQYVNDWMNLNGKPPLDHPTINVPSLDPYLVGQPIKPAIYEQGWKDTIQAEAGEATTIRVRFSPQDGSSYQFDPSSGPGYVWHCHILEHEDNEMMRPYIVVGTSNDSTFLILIIAVTIIVSIIIILRFIASERKKV